MASMHTRWNKPTSGMSRPSRVINEITRHVKDEHVGTLDHPETEFNMMRQDQTTLASTEMRGQ